MSVQGVRSGTPEMAAGVGQEVGTRAGVYTARAAAPSPPGLTLIDVLEETVRVAFMTLALAVVPGLVAALYGFLPALACFALGVVLVGGK